MRASLGSAAIVLIGAFEIAGMFLAIFLVGMDTWIVILFSLVVVACSMKSLGAAVTFTAANAVLGMNFSIFLVGFPAWPSALIGVAAIAVIFMSANSPRSATPEGGAVLA